MGRHLASASPATPAQRAGGHLRLVPRATVRKQPLGSEMGWNADWQLIGGSGPERTSSTLKHRQSVRLYSRTGTLAVPAPSAARSQSESIGRRSRLRKLIQLIDHIIIGRHLIDGYTLEMVQQLLVMIRELPISIVRRVRGEAKPSSTF